jgi:MoaA/NifB/PqqE/SkfB family radical SAM enzyme
MRENITKNIFPLIRLSARHSWQEWRYHSADDASRSNGIFKPTSVNLEISYQCCLRCQMCGLWEVPRNGELSVTQWIGIIRKLKDWLGTFRLTISGGETFLKPGIWDFLKQCEDFGLPMVVLTTGYSLTEKTLQRLLETNITQLGFSLDSLKANRHDEVRGVSGAFERTWNAIQILGKSPRRFILATTTVISSYNIDEIAYIPSALHDIGVDRISFQPVQAGYGLNFPDLVSSNLWPKNCKIVEREIEALIAKKEKGYPVANTIQQLEAFRDYFLQAADWVRPFECPVGRSMFQCDPYGNVRMCTLYQGIIGNLLEDKPEKIWFSDRAKSERKRILSCRTPCLLNCHRIYGIGEKFTYAKRYVHNIIH